MREKLLAQREELARSISLQQGRLAEVEARLRALEEAVPREVPESDAEPETGSDDQEAVS